MREIVNRHTVIFDRYHLFTVNPDLTEKDMHCLLLRQRTFYISLYMISSSFILNKFLRLSVCILVSMIRRHRIEHSGIAKVCVITFKATLEMVVMAALLCAQGYGDSITTDWLVSG